jgi:hypothetical protein
VAGGFRRKHSREDTVAFLMNEDEYFYFIVLLLHRNEHSGRRPSEGAAEGRGGEGLSVGQDEAFLSGEYDTGYLERLLDEES